MAWAEKLQSGRYRGGYRDKAGKKRYLTGTYTTKPDAERAAASEEYDARRKPRGEKPEITWANFEPIWQQRRIVEESTRKSEEPKLKLHVRNYWGNRNLSDIERDDVKEWIKYLQRKDLSPSTIEKCYRLLSGSLRAAIPAYIDVSPCKDIELPKSPPPPERYLEDEEFEAIRASLSDFDQLLVDVLVGTGVRLGEALGIHRESIDTERRVLTVEWSWDYAAKKMKPPKDYERRPIPLSIELSDKLRALLDDEGMGVPPAVKYVGGKKMRSGLLFAHVAGKPVDNYNFRSRFTASCRIAWVGKGKHRRPVGHVRIHDLRHTYASRLVRKGVSLEQLQKLLGHSSIKTTERYAHLADAQWDSVRAVLDGPGRQS